jgi:Tfp pilus assembly protein PilN
MKAVNLIPLEERRGPSGGRSGAGAYAVLGALAVLLLMVAAWTLTGKTVNNRKADLAGLEQKANAAEAQAAQLSAYSAFADLRKKRADTVASIAKSRFDWAHVMHELARVVPTDVHLTSLSGSVAAGQNAPGGTGQALALRGSSGGPAIDLVGCADSQANVSRMISRLRLVDGVQHVTLADSSKNEAAVSSGGGATSTGDNGDCRYNDSIPQFDVLITFAAPPAAAAATAAAAPAAGTAAPVSSTTTTPAGSTK